MKHAQLLDKITIYLQIIDRDHHSTAYLQLVDAYLQLGLLDDALAAARLGTTMLPTFSPCFVAYGQVLRELGRLDEALVAYREALRIDPLNSRAKTGLARLHIMGGRRDLAREVLQEAALAHPGDELISAMLAALELKAPWRRPECPAKPAAAPAEEPVAGEVPILTATLAEIYAQQGLPALAAQVYGEILRADPGNREAARRLAELSGDTGLVADQPADASPTEEAARRVAVLERWLEAIAARRAEIPADHPGTDPQ